MNAPLANCASVRRQYECIEKKITTDNMVFYIRTV